MMTFFVFKLFLHPHGEASALTNDIPEESDHFRFLHVPCLVNIKGSVGLILAKSSDMRISIPLDLPCVLPKRRMKDSSLRVLPTSLTLHSFNVTLFTLGSRLF